MKIYVGVTDKEWFDTLSSHNSLEEVNFWQPSGNRQFRILSTGDLFLFKLHSPLNFIVGGGFFAHSSILPISLAWDAFGFSNGANSLLEMRIRVEKYRRQFDDKASDYRIGCILLEQPFFLPKSKWIQVPPNWKSNIVQGRHYDLVDESGRNLWNQLRNAMTVSPGIQDETIQYGQPVEVFPRLGQGSFRIMVTDAYHRYCAITRERTLPALDAAHIRPFAENGPNIINNGILMRRDLHALFDKGYLTVTPHYYVEVSRRIREEFENGKDYYKFQGISIHLPEDWKSLPSKDYLEWHNLNIFRS